MPEASPRPAFVYLLRCGDGSLYCGWSVDVDRRLAAHRSGRGSRYTAGRLPVELAAAWRTETATVARRLEVQIKRLPRAQKERLVAGEGLPQAAVRSATKASTSAGAVSQLHIQRTSPVRSSHT